MTSATKERERLQRQMPAMQAYIDGKTVQGRELGAGHWYTFTPNEIPLWWDSWEYRVKPEPKVYSIWVNKYFNKETKELWLSTSSFPTQQAAGVAHNRCTDEVYLGAFEVTYTEEE